MARAHIQIPERAVRGDLVEVRVVIEHPMETGFRTDAVGRRIARNAIHTLVCRYNGTEVFRATLSPGIAANPYIRFYTRAVDSGELEFWWLDDDGVEGSARAKMAVT